jgi:hypothetical protein
MAELGELTYRQVELVEKGSNAAKAHLAELKKPSPSIDGKEYADKGNAAKVHLAGSKKPSPSIDGKEYADKRSAAKAHLAGSKKPSPSIAALHRDIHSRSTRICGRAQDRFTLNGAH